MAYLGNSPVLSQQEYRNIDNISGSFNGVTTSFALLVNGVAPVPAPQSSNQCLISVNGVVQKPDDTGATGFRLSGGNIIFSSAPTGGQSFFGVILAGADYIYAGQNFPDGTVSAPSITFNQDLDTGFYRSGAGEVKYTANGANAVTFSSNGLTASNFVPSGSTIPTNGVYLPSANNVAIATNSTQRLLIDSSGQIEAVSLGTAAAPTWSFTTDPNTGIYSPGADQLAISTNGSGRLFINSSGNVGVGTASPEETLDANGAIVWRGSLNSGKTSAGALDRSGNDLRIRAYGATAGTGQLVFRTGGGGGSVDTEAMRIDASQRVGIGTSSPSSLLHVEGTSGNAKIRLGTGGDHTLIGPDSSGHTIINAGTVGGNMQLQLAGTTKVTLNSTGLGIGTTSPQQLLHVDSGSGGANAAITLRATGYSGNQFNFYAQVTPEVISVIESTERAIAFKANGSERARIDSSGRLLVGTSSASNTFTTALLQGNAADTTGDGVLRLARGAATPASGNGLGYIVFSDSGHVDAAYIFAARDGGTWSGSSKPTRLVFSTTADGASSPTERMRISQNGVVTIKNGAVAEIGTLTDGVTITPDFTANCNFTVTLGGNRTLANPTNVTAGQSGSIFIIQDATGSRTLSWGSNWDWAAGTAPTLTTTANAVDRVDYVCRTATSIHAVFTANYS